MTSLIPSARPLRRGLLVAAVALAGTVSACEDPFELTAQLPNVDASLEFWAITGSPAAYPSGLLVTRVTAVRLDAGGSFDLAFDIDTLGRLRVLPMNSVVSPSGGTRAIEFLRAPSSYSVIAEAPREGWSADSVLLMGMGQAFLVKTNQPVYCALDFRQDIVAKFLVDSIIPEERRIKLTMRMNPNCGFRSLLNGFPEF
jgi:hypothetical protein